MRELIFQNAYYPKPKKRVVAIEETVARNGIVTHSEKKSMYFIRNRYHIESQNDLKRWAEEKKKNTHLNRRYFYIMRKHSDKEGADALMCKARGVFYAIVGKDIYNIVFVHSLKMTMAQAG